jgi:hypothetical protein
VKTDSDPRDVGLLKNTRFVSGALVRKYVQVLVDVLLIAPGERPQVWNGAIPGVVNMDRAEGPIRYGGI